MIKLFILAGASFFQPQDSLGTETINGKVFVIHKVGEKETLYGISKRYGTTIDAIVQNNASAADGILDIGEILKVPYGKPATVTTTRTNSNTNSGNGGLIHVVTAKETLFSISRAYGVSMDEIKQWNNLSDKPISIGQELAIRKRNTVTTATETTSNETNISSPSVTPKGFHAVEAKETLYSIATKYNVSVPQLKEWNNLGGDELKIGQQLRVSPGQNTETIVAVQQATTETVKTAEPVKVENTTQTSTQNTNPQPVKNEPTIHITESKGSGDEVLESGLAELIEGTDGNRKYLALHRTAPVGTILKVKNEMNNREVFVRVMGKLPDNAMSDKLVIKISKSAYDRLGAIDPRFRVQVTYYK